MTNVPESLGWDEIVRPDRLSEPRPSVANRVVVLGARMTSAEQYALGLRTWLAENNIDEPPELNHAQRLIDLESVLFWGTPNVEEWGERTIPLGVAVFPEMRQSEGDGMIPAPREYVEALGRKYGFPTIACEYTTSPDQFAITVGALVMDHFTQQ